MNRFRDPQTSGAYTPEYHQLFGSSTWITLKNVSPLLNEGDLVSIFSQFGVVVDVVIPRTAPHKAKENNILLTTAAGGEDLATQRGLKRARENNHNHHHSNEAAVELTLPQRNTLYFLEFELVGSAIAAADCMNSCPPIHTLPATQQKQLKALQAANVTARPPPPIIRNPSSSGGGGGGDEPQHQQAIQSAHHNLAGPFRSLLLPGHDTVGLVVDRCTIKEVPVHDKLSSKAALVPLLSSSSSTAAGGGGGGSGGGGGGQNMKPQPLPPHPIHGLGRRPTEPAAVYPSFPEWTLAQLAARQKKIRAAVATSQ